MEANINASPEALASLADLLYSFSDRMEEHISALCAVTVSLADSLDDEEANILRRDIGQIRRVLENSAVDLEILRNGVEQYHGFLTRMRAIALGAGGAAAAAGAAQFGIGSSSALARAATASPRSLSQTQYGFELLSVGGQTYMMYNKPRETAQKLIKDQGQNSKNMRGTCGLCQCANILRLAGIEKITEDGVIDVAKSCSADVVKGLDLKNPNPDDRGGTSAWGRQEILSKFNLETDITPISSDRNAAVSQLAKQVSSGHGVIVSVDAGVFWNSPQYLGGGHAISLISASPSGDMFYYSDTGTGKSGLVSASHLARSLTGRPANVTRRIIR